MIELLGIGVPCRGGGWALRRLCAHIGRELTIVVSSRPEERHALLDALGGRIVPAEGRAWINGVPLMAETVRRVRRLVAEVRAASLTREISEALRRAPEYVLVRDIDSGLTGAEVVRAFALLDDLRRSGRVGVIVSTADLALARRRAERLIVLDGGRAVFDGAPHAQASAGGDAVALPA